MKQTIYTIGHSNQTIDMFVDLLNNANIKVVVDVRSSPFSAYVSQFNRGQIEKTLSSAGMEYFYLGQALGGRSNDPQDFSQGQVQYEKLSKKPAYEYALDELTNKSKNSPTAIMCSEKDPIDCHRSLLISESLVDKDIQIKHIHSNGNIESHEKALERLLIIHKLNQADLFSTEEERLIKAIKLQEEKVAYRIAEPEFEGIDTA